jgi:replicative DNA helicase
MDTHEPLPPQEPSAEYNFLVLMLRHPDAARRAIQLVRPEDFYPGGLRKIFTVAQKMVNHEERLDLRSLRNALARQGLLDQVGGQSFLDMLERSLAGPEPFFDCESAAGLIRNAALARKLIAFSVEVIRKSFAPHCNALELLREARAVLDKLAAACDAAAHDRG